MIVRFVQSQFGRFLVTGGIAAMVNLLSRVVYDVWLSYSVSIVLAYGTGMITAYLLARRFVFTSATRTAAESAPRFAIVNGVGVLQTWLVSVALATYVLPALGVRVFVHEIAHLVGVAVPVVTSYFGHRLWTFRDASAEREVA